MLLLVSLLGCGAAHSLTTSTPESVYPDITSALGEERLSCEPPNLEWTRSTIASAHVSGGPTKLIEMLTCWDGVAGSGTWHHRVVMCPADRSLFARTCSTIRDAGGPWSRDAQIRLAMWVEVSGFEALPSLVSAPVHYCMDEISVVALETGPGGHLIVRGCPRFGRIEPNIRTIINANINIPFERDPDAFWSSRQAP